MQRRIEKRYVPNTLEMHRSNLDHVAGLLALQDAVTTTARHAGHVEVRDLCRAPLVVPRQSVILCPFAIRVRDDVCEL